jgi:hypothetical protein
MGRKAIWAKKYFLRIEGRLNPISSNGNEIVTEWVLT